MLKELPYQRLKEALKDGEEESEDQKEDQVHEEHTCDDDPDEQPLGEPLHVEPNDLEQQGGHQQPEGGADRIREPQQRPDGNGQVAGKFWEAVWNEGTARWCCHRGGSRGTAEPCLALAAVLVLGRVIAVPALRAGSKGHACLGRP